MFKRAAVIAVSCGALLAGCGTGPEAEQQEVISNLLGAGFAAEAITVVDEAVYLEGDVHVTLEASRELYQPERGTKEHYRVANLVDTNIVRKICLIPTSTFNAYSRLSAGLDAAIQNYNALGLRFVMARGPTTGCDANITVTTMSGAGGSAGFPSNGLPYSQLRIGTGLQSYSLDVNEHVITHELGHSLGLLHSDILNNPPLCATSGTSYPNPIHIPGTPTTSPLSGSLMNSCFRSTETGEFTSTDVTAFQVLYGL
jgi:hypothetical protein